MDSYQTAKEEIKRTADIVELIGQYVQLKKAGQNHMGLCPFHSEKAPSFTVSSTKQMFHCFGCKKGGDIFVFWMEYHKVSFPQAVKELAEKYHIALPERRMTPQQKLQKELRDSIYEINEIAAGYYHDILMKTDKGLPGREYFKKRSIKQDIVNEFLLGYAPAEWDGLTGFLKKKNVEMTKAEKAGLVIPRKNKGYYDRFRGRVMFPIFDMREKIVGFGARVLDGSLPKYLNTPETEVFNKGELLYGLNKAYGTLRESGRAVIVEGYTDVLALKCHGFDQAVATLGTALTRDHIRKLKGYTREALVVFDSDNAGKAATIKSLPLFLNEGLSAKAMILPEGHDPDSFINKRGLEDFLELMEKAVPMFEYYLDLQLSQMDRGIEGQVDLLKEVLPILSSISNDAQRSLYVHHFCEKCGIAESILLVELENYRIPNGNKKSEGSLREKLEGSTAKSLHDIHLLNLLTHFPYTIGRMMECDCKILISDPVVREIFDSVYRICDGDYEIAPSEILERLDGDLIRERFREAMLSPSIYPDDSVEQALREIRERIDRIRFSKSLTMTKGSLEEKNRLLMLKRNMQDDA